MALVSTIDPHVALIEVSIAPGCEEMVYALMDALRKEEGLRIEIPQRRGICLNKRFHINTMGCQMNEYDSDFLAQSLIKNGFFPEEEVHRADVILINTCAVRAKPEQKACSFLGRMADLKEKKPGTGGGHDRMPGPNEGERIDEAISASGLCHGSEGTGSHS
jgi:hypothetical protein